MMNNATHPGGFTLVETLVAISILLISIIGPMYSVFQAVQSTYIARDQLIATALAQEGIEYVQHHRDSNYLYNLQNPSNIVEWLSDLAPCRAGKTCMVDVTVPDTTPPVTCGSTCTPLSLSPTTNIYAYSGPASRFTRSVKITDLNANEAIVTSTVTWVNSHVPFTVTVTEHLYNWL
jgi:prepilin-type N-terminal cleavage/methylation domain-containing protein